MPNSRFTELLDASPLSDEDKYNLGSIFNVLKDDRKIDIIDHWQDYLRKILLIEHAAEKEKEKQIQLAFEKINYLIDEWYRRDQQQKAEKEKQRQEEESNMIAAAEYNNRRQREKIIELERQQEESRARLLDPLAFI